MKMRSRLEVSIACFQESVRHRQYNYFAFVHGKLRDLLIWTTNSHLDCSGLESGTPCKCHDELHPKICLVFPPL
ncbi:unnamed protein product [Allacma fusca]|uniref:Uncharacterized protein n=1 Tax=Allacma fusca TaxID=39272 RepID=A0A8J2JXJ0_9HEXA|nr:unnamed protein product [Allacma fusca]